MLSDGSLLGLSVREYGLLAQLATNDRQPVPRAMLLDALYARQDETAQRALESLVRRTRQKIAARYSCPSVILAQHGLGYFLSVPFAPE